MSMPAEGTVPGSNVSEANNGFIVGVDPPAQPLTPEQMVAATETAVSQSQASNAAPPLQIVEEPQQAQPQGNSRFFTEEDVNKIRSEEKEKLYSRLNTYEQQLADLQKEKEEREAAERQRLEEIEAERKRKEEETMEVRDLLERREQEFNQRLSEMEQRIEQERAVMEQEKRFMELQQFRQAAIEQNANEIMPELRDLVVGNSVEEIEASIDAMKARTAAIMQSMQSAVNEQRQAMRGTAPTAPPVGPMEQGTSFETITPEQIRDMDQATYAKYRARLLQSASPTYRSGG